MNPARSAARVATRSSFTFEDTLPSVHQRAGALVVCGLLIGAVYFSLQWGLAPGPEIKPFIPITATIWALANLLTAFLLLAQFYVNGNIFFGILSVAYACTGLMTLPYLATFPGIVFPRGATSGEQIPIYLWSIWHATFPAIIICAVLTSVAHGHIFSRRAILVATVGMIVVPIVVIGALCVLLSAFREVLPLLVVRNHFQPSFCRAFLPSVILLDAIACGVLLRWYRPTPLALWLSVAIFSAALDAFLNLRSSGYSYAWDTGKLITVFTSSVVLVMILCDIVGLYGRLSRVARTDVLTALPNRRAFEEHFDLLYSLARQRNGSVGLLVIDIDFFKKFNDTHGHLGGDECLRQIAQAMLQCVTRPLDLIARYGGEEFVVVLPQTPLSGVMVMAERIRHVVEELDIVQNDRPLGRVTLSIGIAYAADVAEVDVTALFRDADRGLYDAKERGRNQVVFAKPAEAVPASFAAGRQA